MQPADSVVPFSRNREPKFDMPANSGQILRECRDRFDRQLRPLVQRMFESADDTLFQYADKATNNTLQATYFDAMRELRLQRREMEGRFQHSLSQAFRSFEQGEARAKTGGAGGGLSMSSLSLVDNDELEESLAVQAVVEKARGSAPQELSALGQRLGHLMGSEEELASDSNPFGPEAMGRALQEAMGSAELTLEVRLILFKLGERSVMVALGPIWRELNGLLIDAGVLPTLRPPTPMVMGGRGGAGPSAGGRGASSPAATPAPGLDESGMAPGDEGGDLGSLGDLLSMLRANAGWAPWGGATAGTAAAGLVPPMGGPLPPGGVPMAGIGAPLPPGVGLGTGGGGQPAYPPGQPGDTAYSGGVTLVPSDVAQQLPALLQLLSGLQRQAGGEALPQGAGLREVLGSTIEERKVAVGSREADVIDLVSMLFEFILDDPNLSDTVKALIGRLQIPYIKVALLDRHFFARKNHTARRFLNRLAEFALAIEPEVEGEENARLDLLRQIVERLLTEFEEDLGLFETLSADLERFEAEAQQAARAAEEALLAAQRRREEEEEVRIEVLAAVDRALKELIVPPELAAIIRGPWVQVLVSTRLKEGEGATWRERLGFIDELAWSVRPRRTAAERQVFARHLPKLLRRLDQGLELIGISLEQRIAIRRKLEPYHLADLRPATPAAAPPATPPQAEATPPPPILQREVASAPAAPTTVPPAATTAAPLEGRGKVPLAAAAQAALAAVRGNGEAVAGASPSPAPVTPTKAEGVMPPADEVAPPPEPLAEDPQEVAAEAAPAAPSSKPAPHHGGDPAVDDLIAQVEQQLSDLARFEAMLNGEEEPEEEAPAEPEYSATDDWLAELSATPAEGPDVEERWLEEARELRVGTWVQIVEQGRERRAKLAWKSDLLGEFTFVNWKFQVVAERNLATLACDLRDGVISTVDDVPVLDRALNAMVQRFSRL